MDGIMFTVSDCICVIVKCVTFHSNIFKQCYAMIVMGKPQLSFENQMLDNLGLGMTALLEFDYLSWYFVSLIKKI